MLLSIHLAGALVTLASFVLASPVPNDAPKDKRSFVERDGTNYTVFEHAATGAKMEFVTNSGICEVSDLRRGGKSSSKSDLGPLLLGQHRASRTDN